MNKNKAVTVTWKESMCLNQLSIFCYKGTTQQTKKLLQPSNTCSRCNNKGSAVLSRKLLYVVCSSVTIAQITLTCLQGVTCVQREAQWSSTVPVLHLLLWRNEAESREGTLLKDTSYLVCATGNPGNLPNILVQRFWEKNNERSGRIFQLMQFQEFPVEFSNVNASLCWFYATNIY